MGVLILLLLVFAVRHSAAVYCSCLGSTHLLGMPQTLQPRSTVAASLHAPQLQLPPLLLPAPLPAA
jgi:hypothetical protein